MTLEGAVRRSLIPLLLVAASGCGHSALEALVDSGPADSGAPIRDAGLDGGDASDAGPSDAGAADAGPADAGSGDAGSATDAGSVEDAGPVDGGPEDSGPPDAGRADAGHEDAGKEDGRKKMGAKKMGAPLMRVLRTRARSTPGAMPELLIRDRRRMQGSMPVLPMRAQASTPGRCDAGCIPGGDGRYVNAPYPARSRPIAW